VLNRCGLDGCRGFLEWIGTTRRDLADLPPTKAQELRVHGLRLAFVYLYRCAGCGAVFSSEVEPSPEPNQDGEIGAWGYELA